MFFKFFLIACFLGFVSSCGLKIGEPSKGPNPFNLGGKGSEKCRDIDYKQIFMSYFNQELMIEKSLLQQQNNQIDRAIFCIKKILEHVISEVRGDEKDSLTKEELITLLKQPLIQEPLKELGVKNVELLIADLTNPETFNRWMEVKNFLIEVIRNFPSGLSSEKVCNSSRDRLYKWEMEVFVSFLDVAGGWMKDMNSMSEEVYERFFKNVKEADPAFSDRYISLSSEEKYMIKRDLLSNSEYKVKYLLPALGEGFSGEAPDLSEYLKEIPVLLSEPFLWDFWSEEAKRKEQAEKLLLSISSLVGNNKINSSEFLKKSDLLFIVMGVSLADTLFGAYNKDGDFQVTKKEFLDSTLCLEDFLLPLFKNEEDYLYYFIEFQEDPRKNRIDVLWEKLIWDDWIWDEDLSLARGDFLKLVTLLISERFPYDLVIKEGEKSTPPPEDSKK